jgi:hypothetical protein
VCAARRSDTMTRWIVGGTASEQLALSIGERQVAGMVSGFASREEAIETYPELADATTGGPDPYEAHWERCSTPAELAVERQMANPEQDAKELQAVADYWRDQEERGN